MRACKTNTPMAMSFGSILMWHNVMVGFLPRQKDVVDEHRGSKNRDEQGDMLATFEALRRLTSRLAVSYPFR